MVIIDIASRIDNEGKATQGRRGAHYSAVVWAVIRRGLMAVSVLGGETSPEPKHHSGHLNNGKESI